MSNFRRHALCEEARVELTCEAGRVLLRIKNPRPDGNGDLGFSSEDQRDKRILFTPRSIAERTAMLGGDTKVSIDDNNYTVVTVNVPL